MRAALRVPAKALGKAGEMGHNQAGREGRLN
jgi:hypothetical protein